jgi:proline iminopeptidase
MSKNVPAVSRAASDYYPEIEPFCTGMLAVSGGHQIYFEESGNPAGKPVVLLHGGPGGGTQPSYRRLFNPDVYRIIMFDQRGCGKSLPFASLENNTTWDLVSDIEALRKHFGIDRWTVFGGSWGSTLAITYAETHPERVSELVLRGIFLGRKKELDWLYQFGASEIFPDYWQQYLEQIPVKERRTPNLNLSLVWYVPIRRVQKAAINQEFCFLLYLDRGRARLILFHNDWRELKAQ